MRYRYSKSLGPLYLYHIDRKALFGKAYFVLGPHVLTVPLAPVKVAGELHGGEAQLVQLCQGKIKKLYVAPGTLPGKEEPPLN